MLLDDLIAEIDDMDEKRRAEKNEKIELDESVRVAGDSMREAALTRKRKNNDGDISGTTKMESLSYGGSSTVTKKTKRAVDEISDEDEADMLVKQMRQRSQMESKRFELEESLFPFDEEREERIERGMLNQQ